MEMIYYQSSYQESLNVIEADVQHANSLAAAIPRAKGGVRFEMKLVYNHWAPLFLFLLQWIDSSCTCLLPRYLNFFHILVYKVYTDGRPNISTHGRKATIRDFYSVILPSLQRLHGDFGELDDAEEEHPSMKISGKKLTKGDSSLGSAKIAKGDSSLGNAELEREEECGICLEPCTKMVLPNCCHEMCIKCYRNWNRKSEACPFCRGNIKRVNSEDLWVLTCNDDVVDTETVSREDLLRFYLYINSLPKDYPDALFLVYYEYSNLI
ncbi:putative transcription factor C2H2 family [Rosa chinensis]|uniref:Putative transcription factor C2H2 family n=1 Tax=Rosa chinensis TaxID=74649 RepID=A0A2P6R0V5_ROSCH|nr:E3 ubiquitin-protein ligase AIRP2 [Rosa chinensis]PRQ40061.1 putative transcription factor C2H2 family [Rosa chinensis]